MYPVEIILASCTGYALDERKLCFSEVVVLRVETFHGKFEVVHNPGPYAAGKISTYAAFPFF